jgi:pentatricopeptide repeat protein
MKGLKRELGQACKNRLTDEESINGLYKKYKIETDDCVSVDCAQMMMNLAQTNVEMTKEIITNIPPKQRTEPMYTLLVKGYCLNGNITEARRMLDCMMTDGIKPHVRTFVPIFKYDHLNYDHYSDCISLILSLKLVPTLELFGLIFRHRHRFQYVSLLKLMSDHYNEVTPEIAKGWDAQPCKIDRKSGFCKTSGLNLQRCDATTEQKQLMRDCLLYDGIEKLNNYIDDKNIKVVVDGSNVAMYNNSPFNIRKVEAVLSRIPEHQNVLLVFHIGRKRMVQKQLKDEKITFRKGIHIWYSKIGEDDDLSWLYVTLKMDCRCITSDKLRDHLYYRFSKAVEQFTFDKWIEQHVIRFKFCGESHNYKADLKYPPKYSIRTNVNLSDKKISIHFPTKSNDSTDVVWWYASHNTVKQ